VVPEGRRAAPHCVSAPVDGLATVLGWRTAALVQHDAALRRALVADLHIVGADGLAQSLERQATAPPEPSDAPAPTDASAAAGTSAPPVPTWPLSRIVQEARRLLEQTAPTDARTQEARRTVRAAVDAAIAASTAQRRRPTAELATAALLAALLEPLSLAVGTPSYRRWMYALDLAALAPLPAPIWLDLVRLSHSTQKRAKGRV